MRAPRTAFVGRSIDLAALTQAVAPTATVRAALEPLDLGDLAVFCRQACVPRELRPYQVEAGSAIVASVAAQRGDLLTAMMARQMGTVNERHSVRCGLYPREQRRAGQG